MLQTTLPFKGYNSFIVNVISRLSQAVEEGTTPIFLTVGGITPDEIGNGPARMQMVEAEDLEKYEEKTKEYTAIIRNFISDTKENLKDYKYKFVCYLTNLKEINMREEAEQYNVEESLIQEAEEGADVEVELPSEEQSRKELTTPFMQIFIRDTDSSENIWKTRIPMTVKVQDKKLDIKFHFEQIETDNIDIVKSEVLDELRDGTL